MNEPTTNFKNGDKIFDKEFNEQFIYDEKEDKFVCEKYPERFEKLN